MSDITSTITEFVLGFMSKHDSLINCIGRKYLIPNRYTIEDIKQYISERIIHILTNRLQSENNKIEDPNKYFRSCLDFYCIEYQRMHGYIFELPKRPRKNCEKDEEYIRSFGFKYFKDMTKDEFNSLITKDRHEVEYTGEVWIALLSILSKEEADVVDCIFNKNMTWLETSQYLAVPQSTCWLRKDRALEKIFRAFENIDGDKISDNIKKFLRGNSRVLRLYGEG